MTGRHTLVRVTAHLGLYLSISLGRSMKEFGMGQDSRGDDFHARAAASPCPVSGLERSDRESRWGCRFVRVASTADGL